MDTKAFFHKFELDLMDEQAELNGAVPNYVPNFGHKTDAASAWGDIGTFLPMTLWKYYGDKEELAFAWPMMKGWVDYMDRLDTDRRYTFRYPVMPVICPDCGKQEVRAANGKERKIYWHDQVLLAREIRAGLYAGGAV